MTVTWHVDDLKVSHQDPFEITLLADYLQGIYGNVDVHRGKIHDYLGVDFDFTERKKVKVSQIKYLCGVLKEFPEEITGTAATPAAEHLFVIRPDDDPKKKYLPEEQAVTFHRTTAQLLFMSNRARRDIQTAVSFLTTRVKKPDEDDWGKLKRVLKYLNGTRYMKLTLEVNNLGVIKWWVDASHNVHEDCRGHTGALMTLGKGAAISGSWKHKLNTKSSTESELVGADQVLSQCLNSKYFIEAQGYKVDQNIMFQDNQAAIRLEVNGRFSSSKRTKHIKAKYFFIKDKVDCGDVEIQYCPTEKMWSDVLTKPKQGKGFRVDRSHLMNLMEDYDDEVERRNTNPLLIPQEWL